MKMRTRTPAPPINPDTLLDQVSASLRCLGDTPGEVHWSLLYEGVKGMRQASYSGNPVIGYLARRLDLAGRLEIVPGSRELFIRVDDREFRLPLPPAVISFLERFHQGFYPAVEAG